MDYNESVKGPQIGDAIIFDTCAAAVEKTT